MTSNELAASKQDDESVLAQTNLPIRESGIIIQPTISSESMGTYDMDLPFRVLVVDDEDVVQFHSAGADMVIGKPVRLNLLQMLLRHAKQHGTHSRPGMHLSEGDHGGGMLTWQ
eukprot:gene22505-30766_t